MEPRTLRVAAVQLDANPATTADRLARAERLVTAAAQAGSQLTVLPELFNTGYTFGNDNHDRVEPLDGPTVRWMSDTAARVGVHLAGSLMMLGERISLISSSSFFSVRPTALTCPTSGMDTRPVSVIS